MTRVMMASPGFLVLRVASEANMNDSKQMQLGMMPAVEHDLAARPERIGKTAVEYTQARSILNRATGFLSSYDFTLNPFAGCSFGCTYCYAVRFSGRNDAEDSWGQWVDVKENAVGLIGKIPAGSLDGKRIYMSSVTDPYQSIERRARLTRGILEALVERHKPKMVVQTRSPDVTRDIDLFHALVECGGKVQVNMTVTTDDEELRRAFEPGCPSNTVRLNAVAEVQKAGIQSCITMTPLLLVRNAAAFADALLTTGVKRFITQPFHVGSAQFVAGTRQAALQMMAERLGCGAQDVVRQHMLHYNAVRAELMGRLPGLGEGREGFAPPF